MTECSRTGAGRDDGSDARDRQIVFSFGEEVKPILKFDAAAVTADASLAPLRELDERLGLTALAATFIEDFRQPDMIVHPIDRLLRETAYAYAAGYEDANDHTPLSYTSSSLACIERVSSQLSAILAPKTRTRSAHLATGVARSNGLAGLR